MRQCIKMLKLHVHFGMFLVIALGNCRKDLAIQNLSEQQCGKKLAAIADFALCKRLYSD